jgi:hypothetical protein
MTEEMNKTIDTTAAADQSPVPNGHGTGNGVAAGPTGEGVLAEAPLSKKQKKALRRAAAATATTTASVAPPPDAPIAAPITASLETPAEVPVEAPVEAPVETPVESLRVRLKIWIHPQTTKRYLMPTAFMRDVVNGQPVSDVMVAYAMRDDDTVVVTLTVAQWNAMPFFYMQEDGSAPRATSRPIDVITSRGRPGWTG